MAAHSKKPLIRAEKVERSANQLQQSPFIAAIDFGTSSLSLSYTTPFYDKVNTLKLHKTYERVPNAILIHVDEDNKCTVEDIGHNAQTAYSKLGTRHMKQYIYFERIKMLLERDKSVDRTNTVPSFTGGSYYLIEVIAFIIKYIKDQLVDHLSDGQRQYHSTEFDWVITVPAIWKARAKRMMREAAYLAALTSDEVGITSFTDTRRKLHRPQEVDAHKLSLALEPEAAALYAQYYSTNDTSSEPTPDRYMVVDIGGGTVDITVHDKRDGKVNVILPPTGNTWGGTTVNRALSCMLEDLVQDKEFSAFIKSRPKARADINKIIYEEFEDEKKKFGDKYTETDAASKEIAIDLPRTFVDFYSATKLDEGATRVGIVFEAGEDTLYISYSLVEEKLFQPTIDGIVLCVLEALEKLTGKVDTIYLVGGFGGCNFTYKKVDEAISKYHGDHYDHIVCPQQPDLAVAVGAVMWRQDPNIIQSRIADATYGLHIGTTFDPTIHDEHYRYLDEEDGKNRCGNVFCVSVLKGEVIGNEIYMTTYIPHNQSDATATLEIYSTADNGVQYIKDKEGKFTAQKIGKLIIDIPNPDNIPRDERFIDVFMDFSGTEIQATARYRITGETVTTVCDFLSNRD